MIRLSVWRATTRAQGHSPAALEYAYRVHVAGWSSPVARWAHNPKVGGSNPPPRNDPFSYFLMDFTAHGLAKEHFTTEPAVRRSPSVDVLVLDLSRTAQSGGRLPLFSRSATPSSRQCHFRQATGSRGECQWFIKCDSPLICKPDDNQPARLTWPARGAEASRSDSVSGAAGRTSSRGQITVSQGMSSVTRSGGRSRPGRAPAVRIVGPIVAPVEEFESIRSCKKAPGSRVRDGVREHEDPGAVLLPQNPDAETVETACR